MHRNRRRIAISRILPECSPEHLERIVDWSIDLNIGSIRREIEIISSWMTKINKTFYDLSIDELYSIYQRKMNRRERLIAAGKRIDITDKELVEVYITDPVQVDNIYQSICSDKTKSMIQKMDDNPELRWRGTLEQCINKFNGNIDEAEKYLKELHKRHGYSVSIQYFMDLGHDEETAKKLLSERQATFTLEKCIARHGKEEGTRIWQDRQNRWQNTLKSKSQEEIDLINRKKSISFDGFIARGFTEDEATDMLSEYWSSNGRSYSKESMILFESSIPNQILKNAYYADREFYIYDHDYKCRRLYDFMYKGVMIEYHGIAFHPNPSTFSPERWESWHHPYTKENADAVYSIDQHRKQLAIRNGFYVFEIYSDMTDEQKVDITNQAILMMLSRSNLS